MMNTRIGRELTLPEKTTTVWRASGSVELKLQEVLGCRGCSKGVTKNKHIRDIVARTKTFCHGYATFMMIIMTKTRIIEDIVGS